MGRPNEKKGQWGKKKQFLRRRGGKQRKKKEEILVKLIVICAIDSAEYFEEKHLTESRRLLYRDQGWILLFV